MTNEKNSAFLKVLQTEEKLKCGTVRKKMANVYYDRYRTRETENKIKKPPQKSLLENWTKQKSLI